MNGTTPHTPGPWRFDDAGKVLFGSDHGTTHHLGDGSRKTCAELGHCTTECGPTIFGFAGKKRDDHVPSAADRALIEAAPDLLEALMELKRQIHEFAVNHGEADFFTDDATVAIAKATGRVG